MVDPSVLPAFLAVILLFLAPPGPDMAYMVAVGLQGGRRAAVQAILGIGTAMALYAAAVVVGLGRLAEAHPHLLDVVKILGAAYLLWLAISTVRGARRTTDAPPDQVPAGRWYRRGFLVAITNPKIILFFLAVLPGFTGSATSTTLQLAMLAVVNTTSEVVLYGGIGLLAGVFHERFAGRRGAGATLSYVAAVVYVGLAVVIAGEALLA